ncbi:hypothetical protein [Streptomyces sp. NPDC127038]|uniref:hypothetical protein n=1 Tax=Streptomyces sp. NPDC127038 TaxID=3347114 RepID=UPI00365A6CFB
MNSSDGDKRYVLPFVSPDANIPGAGRHQLMIVNVAHTDDGLRLTNEFARQPPSDVHCGGSDLMKAVLFRSRAAGVVEALSRSSDHALGTNPDEMDRFAAQILVLPRSDRWREAITTAALGDWCDPLLQHGHLPSTALGRLRAEARSLHRQLVPLWRRRTRNGRVLSLDADLGGLSLYDLVADEVDVLTQVAGHVFADERLNRVLHALDPDERRAVLAYAQGEGTTWTEAASVVGAVDPEAFGERVRRKARRLAAEQQRRAEHRHYGRSESRARNSER